MSLFQYRDLLLATSTLTFNKYSPTYDTRRQRPNNSATGSLMSTLEEIEAAVQQLPPVKRAEFRAWFLSFDATDWDQQMEDDINAGKLDWLADQAISLIQAGRCSEF